MSYTVTDGLDFPIVGDTSTDSGFARWISHVCEGS